MNIVRRLVAVGVALAASLSASGTLAAQAAGTGTITGRVVDRASQQPLGGVNVLVVGTQRGTQTQDDGTFRIPGVNAGSYQLRAQRIGFGAQTLPVSVQPGATASVDFVLSPAAVQLEQVVISGTGEQERRRERGTSVASIDTSQVNLAAAPNFSSMLQGRTAGVTVQQAAGTSGTSSRIRIRGSNSISLSNEPLLIVDGVVVNNSTDNTALGFGGQTISRWNDINNEDIENIEIVKGPAATALFGTAAANGVIQITTKRGRPGTARWNAYTELGSFADVIDYPANYSQIGTVVSTNAAQNGTRRYACSIDLQTRGLCTPRGTGTDSLLAYSPLEAADPFRTGQRYTYGVNASGGADVATYYLGAELMREQGIYEPNKVRQVNLRSNITAQLRPTFNVAANVGYTNGLTRLPNNDNSVFGMVSQGLLGRAGDCSPSTYQNYLGLSGVGATATSAGTTYAGPCGSRNITTGALSGVDSLSRGYFTANVKPQDFFVQVGQQQFARFIGGLTANWQPLTWLRGVARAGVDRLDRNDETLTPPNRIFYSTSTIEGSRFQQRTEIPTYSANATLTGTFDLPGQVQSNTSVGAQYQNDQFHGTSGSGAVLLAGTGSLAGASARFAVNEINREVVTVGGYVEEKLAWRDRLFVTGALRADDNSAFGSDFGLVYYPATSVSWVISEEPFFPRSSFLDQLRVRAAYGRSGQRPGFRQAVDYFDPVSVRVSGTDIPGITVGGTGNIELRPEISSETEAGLESGLFGGRLGLEFNIFNRVTDDALVQRPIARSFGVSSTQWANLGRIQNRGWEGLINATLFNTRPARFDGTLSITQLKNKIVDLGEVNGEPIPDIFFGFNSSQVHKEGLPAGSYYARKLVSFEDKNQDGLISRVNCPSYGGVTNPQVAGAGECEVVLSDSLQFIGTPLPSRELNLNGTLTLFNNVRVQALINHRGGQHLFNSTEEFRCSTTVTCRAVMDRTTPLAEQARAAARLMGTVGPFIEKADFTRLSELSVTFDLPARVVGQLSKIRGASLTLAGRNLALWTDYSGFDPEVNSNASGIFTTSDFLAQPPTRQFSARVNFNF
ncbi:MAG: SusC/RagA family TonB-linked outer membrane protein [Gemmatimonadaceae bacterium]